jgi:hypothetical protein
MEISNFKSIAKGSLIGTFDITIPEWGALKICECAVFEKDGKKWITLPSRVYEKDGQKKYFGLVKFNETVFKKLEASALTQLDKMITSPQQVNPQHTNDALPF